MPSQHPAHLDSLWARWIRWMRCCRGMWHREFDSIADHIFAGSIMQNGAISSSMTCMPVTQAGKTTVGKFAQRLTCV